MKKLKRWDMYNECKVCHYDYEEKESPTGNWVKADLAEEMLENYSKILNYVQVHYPNNITLIDMIKTAIKKAEE